MSTTARARCRLRSDSERGQSSVELAGSLPIVLVLVFLIIQGFVLLAAVSDMRDAARDGARAAAAKQPVYGAVSDSMFDWVSLDSVSECGPGCVRVSGHAPLGIPGVVAVVQVPISAQASFRVPEH